MILTIQILLTVVLGLRFVLTLNGVDVPRVPGRVEIAILGSILNIGLLLLVWCYPFAALITYLSLRIVHTLSKFREI